MIDDVRASVSRKRPPRGIDPSDWPYRDRPHAWQRPTDRVFDEGAAGLEGWSTLEAEWSNVTLLDVSEVEQPEVR
jgi:hypothetical protein